MGQAYSLEARLLHELAMRIRARAQGTGNSQSAEALRLTADEFDKYADDDDQAPDSAVQQASPPPPRQAPTSEPQSR